MRTAAGDFTSDSEYIRELIRRDQEESIKLQALKSAIQEGLDSGVSDKTVPQVMEKSKPGFVPMAAYRLSRKAAMDIGGYPSVYDSKFRIAPGTEILERNARALRGPCAPAHAWS